MQTHLLHQTLDFGAVGYGDRKEEFRVRLVADHVIELIDDAKTAHRVYELLMLTRPGDVWDYVWVVLEKLPQAIAASANRRRKEAQPEYSRTHPWPEGKMPFKDFTRLFYFADFDTEPPDEAWLSDGNAVNLHRFATHVLTHVRQAQDSVDLEDPLLSHLASRFATNTSAYAGLDREVVRAEAGKIQRSQATHTSGFYATLKRVLQDPDLQSVAYRAEGDYQVLRMLATEQRRRAMLTAKPDGSLMYMCALVDRKASNMAWGSEISYYSEGLGPGDLFVQGVGMGGARIKDLIDTHHRRPGKYVLSTCDEGALSDYDVTSGDGWFLYEKRTSGS